MNRNRTKWAHRRALLWNRGALFVAIALFGWLFIQSLTAWLDGTPPSITFVKKGG